MTLLAVSSTLSWFIAACGGVDIADAAYNFAHAAAAAAAGGALHVGVDVALIRSGAPVGAYRKPQHAHAPRSSRRWCCSRPAAWLLACSQYLHTLQHSMRLLDASSVLEQ